MCIYIYIYISIFQILSAPTICSIDCAALSHDERTIAYSTSTAVKLVDLNTGY